MQLSAIQNKIIIIILKNIEVILRKADCEDMKGWNWLQIVFNGGLWQ
jgi:hypothetical protein